MNHGRRHYLYLFCITFLLVGLVAAGQRYGLDLLYRAEAFTMDLRSRLGRNSPADDRLIYLAIDRPAYWSDVGERIDPDEVDDHPALGMMMKNFPWNRAVWGHLVERLVEDGGAEVVALDLLFENPAQGDTQFRQVLQEHADSVVVGGRLDYQEFGGARIESLITPSESLFEDPTEEAFSEEGRVGHVNLWAWSWNGINRGIEYRLPVRGSVFESLSARAVRKAGKAERLPERTGEHLIRFSGPPGTYRPYPIYQVFVDELWNNFYEKKNLFEDKIVVVGPHGNWQQDYHPTPMANEEMAGPEIHLNALSALLNDEFLHRTSDFWNYGLTVSLGLLALVLMASASFLYRALFLGLLNLTFVLASLIVYNEYGLYVPVVAPLAALDLTGLSLFGFEYVKEQRERIQLRATLDRYISEDVAGEILESQSNFYDALGGRRKPVTVLFADIRGFTSLSEQRTPEEMVSQLNEYLTPMVDLVQKNRGRLDKFIGDEIMAVWGDLFEDAEPAEEARRALETGLEMREELAELNDDWREQGEPVLEFGIGINHGEALFGNLGSSQRMELTVIGDAVNLAARLQGTTKKYGIDLAVSETVKDLTEEHFIFRTVDLVRVKGKTEPTELFTVLGRHGEQLTPNWLDRYEYGVRLYREGSFEEALGVFRTIEEKLPDDGLVELYRQRCERCLEHPPEGPWDPVETLSTK